MYRKMLLGCQRPPILEINGNHKPAPLRSPRVSIQSSRSSGSIERNQRISEETNRLSDRQRALIQNTFVNLEKDPVRNGLKIFVRLFSDHPHYKLVWPQFRAIPDSSLMNAVELRRHASVYMCGLRQIIDSMRDEEELTLQLTRIALAHIKWNVQRNHVINMVEPVCEVIKENNDNRLDAETRESWTTLYEVIANLIEVFRARAQ